MLDPGQAHAAASSTGEPKLPRSRCIEHNDSDQLTKIIGISQRFVLLQTKCMQLISQDKESDSPGIMSDHTAMPDIALLTFSH